MSVNISISNSKILNCNDIINRLKKCNINCRIIETKSIVDENIEIGCLLTFDKKYNDKDKLIKLWDIIKGENTCSHLKIDGLFDGCIYNYITEDKCPGK